MDCCRILTSNLPQNSLMSRYHSFRENMKMFWSRDGHEQKANQIFTWTGLVHGSLWPCSCKHTIPETSLNHHFLWWFRWSNRAVHWPDSLVPTQSTLRQHWGGGPFGALEAPVVVVQCLIGSSDSQPRSSHSALWKQNLYTTPCLNCFHFAAGRQKNS